MAADMKAWNNVAIYILHISAKWSCNEPLDVACYV
jgi:hypothetical protein